MSAVVLAVAAPLRARVVPLPLPEGVIEPETENVGTAEAVKLIPVMPVPLTVTGWFTGVNEKPSFVGVTV